MKIIKNNTLLRYVLIDLVIGFIVFLFMYAYQADSTYVGLMDSVVVSGIIIMSFGWFLYIFNVGIFDIAMYGVKQFGLALIKKRPKKSLDDFLYNKDETSVNVHRALFIAGFVYVLIGAILYVIHYTA